MHIKRDVVVRHVRFASYEKTARYNFVYHRRTNTTLPRVHVSIDKREKEKNFSTNIYARRSPPTRNITSTFFPARETVLRNVNYLRKNLCFRPPPPPPHLLGIASRIQKRTEIVAQYCERNLATAKIRGIFRSDLRRSRICPRICVQSLTILVRTVLGNPRKIQSFVNIEAPFAKTKLEKFFFKCQSLTSIVL